MGSRHSSTILKTVLKSAFLLTLTGTAVLGSQNADVKVNAKSDSSLSSELNPVPASYGYFVDHYQENVKTNSTPDTNPAIALFNNTFLTYWNPTTSTTHHCYKRIWINRFKFQMVHRRLKSIVHI